MAGLAPSDAITLATVVIHFYRCPRRGAGVAGHAGHGSAGQQLVFGDVVGRLAGGCAAVMTTGAVGGDRECAVVGLGTSPNGGRFVASLATGCGGNMTAVLAGCDVSVMAIRTTRHYRNVGVELSRCPAGVSLVAAGAVDSGRDVVGILAGRTAAVVAA